MSDESWSKRGAVRPIFLLPLAVVVLLAAYVLLGKQFGPVLVEASYLKSLVVTCGPVAGTTAWWNERPFGGLWCDAGDCNEQLRGLCRETDGDTGADTGSQRIEHDWLREWPIRTHVADAHANGHLVLLQVTWIRQA
jgi:hypothetical protein